MLDSSDGGGMVTIMEGRGYSLTQCEIRDARPDDAEGIVAVLNPIIDAGAYTVLEGPLTADAEREFMRSCPPRGVFLVAIDRADGAVVGFQNTQPLATYTHAFDHVGEIGTYVDLSRRRQGIAKQLFQATIERALGRGYEKLFAFVRADNPVSLQTYVHFGFEVVGTARRHAKLHGRYVDETIIEKLLS
jgi:L-amino acid N-acyltransferase YncA